jgi:hypothetical protein
MDTEVDRWFAEYLTVFAACGRGERPASDLLGCYAVPLLLTSDDAVVSFATADEVTGWVQSQVEALLAADYDRTEVLDLDVAALNANTALCRGTFSRQRTDGVEIMRLTVSYVIIGAADSRRISALLLHAP